MAQLLVDYLNDIAGVHCLSEIFHPNEIMLRHQPQWDTSRASSAKSAISAGSGSSTFRDITRSCSSSSARTARVTVPSGMLIEDLRSIERTIY
jgi:hypothetical protein